MIIGFLGKSSILAKKCFCLTLAPSLLLVNFDLDGMDRSLLLTFSPWCSWDKKWSYRQSIQSELSSAPAFSWEPSSGREACGGPLFGLANFMWWCTLNDAWGASISLIYMLSLCFHFIPCLHLGVCALQVWGEGFRKEKNICFLCFVFFF